MPENLVVCSKCGGVNRLPPSRPAIGAKCGKCGAKVFVGHPEDVDAEIFDRQIGRGSAARAQRSRGRTLILVTTGERS